MLLPNLGLLWGVFLLSVQGGVLDDAGSPTMNPHHLQLADGVSEEQLLQEDMQLQVDADGFAGMDAAMALSAEEFQARSSYLQGLEQQLATLGFQSVDVPGDGSCQFHAVVVAAGLDVSSDDLRKNTIAYMANNPLIFAPFVHGILLQISCNFFIRLSKTCLGNLKMLVLSSMYCLLCNKSKVWLGPIIWNASIPLGATI